MPDLGVGQPTRRDIGRHPELKITSGSVADIMRFRCRPMSGRVRATVRHFEFRMLGDVVPYLSGA